MSRFLVALMLLAAAIVVAGQSSSTENNTPECPPNQIWSICGTLCEPSCADQNPNPLFCPGIQCSELTSGCRCQNGYFRKNGECVEEEQCST